MVEWVESHSGRTQDGGGRGHGEELSGVLMGCYDRMAHDKIA